VTADVPEVPYAELEVLATGPQALVQDLGRPGLAAVGVGRSGAADRAAFALGARLLGQGPTLAAIEVLLGGLVVRARSSVTVVLTGAPVPATVDGTPVAHGAPFLLSRGRLLRLGTPVVGLRTYVSVRGGIDVPAVLGSRASDTLSGIGPSPLRAGDVLPVGQPQGEPSVDVAPVASPSAGQLTLRLLAGPRGDWLAEPHALVASTWTVSAQSDRVGLRLDGPVLRRAAGLEASELPSEGLVRGALQVPAAGQPVLFLADHPVTGGYPVVAVVREIDVDRAAQAVPGQGLRFLAERSWAPGQRRAHGAQPLR
jgi:biotin-dependent carboxylase-like uncharacterized protein